MTSIKSLIISSLVGLLTLWTPDSTIQKTENNPIHYECEVENTVFQDGETITYVLYYHLTPFWIKAGEVTFEMSDKGSHYYVRAEGRTASSFEWFYKVRDVYECEIDKETLRPIRSERDIREGSYKKISKAEFDFENNQIIAKTGKTEESLKEITEEMDDCMHDVLSIIYHARNMDYDHYNQHTSDPYVNERPAAEAEAGQISSD